METKTCGPYGGRILAHGTPQFRVRRRLLVCLLSEGCNLSLVYKQATRNTCLFLFGGWSPYFDNSQMPFKQTQNHGGFLGSFCQCRVCLVMFALFRPSGFQTQSWICPWLLSQGIVRSRLGRYGDYMLTSLYFAAELPYHSLNMGVDLAKKKKLPRKRPGFRPWGFGPCNH